VLKVGNVLEHKTVDDLGQRRPDDRNQSDCQGTVELEEKELDGLTGRVVTEKSPGKKQKNKTQRLLLCRRRGG